MLSRRPTLSPTLVVRLVTTILAASDLHAKQRLSIAHAVIGAMFADRAGSAAFGRAMASARGVNPKHAIKQVDRLMGNEKIDPVKALRAHVRFAVGARHRVVASLDWTEYDDDGHHRIALNLVTRHGRATPLLWKTVTDAQLTRRRNDHEDELLRQFKRLLPETLREVIILADRGFGDVELYDMLRGELGFHFIIRFRGCIAIQDPESGLTARAAKCVPPNGRARLIAKAKVTRRRFEVEAVVAVKQRDMKEAWLLASSLPWKAAPIVKLYGRRFTCEENFRDEKDPRFGQGTLNVRIGEAQRRDRLLLVLAIATALLTLLGAAGEALGLDRMLRANTVARRTHSLVRQGREYLRGAIGKLRDAATKLRRAFMDLVRHQPRTEEAFGEI